MEDGQASLKTNTLAQVLLDHSDLGVIGLDAQGRVMVWNSWMEARTYVAAAAARNRTLAEIFPDLSPQASAVLDTVFATGQPRVLSPVLRPVWIPLAMPTRQFVRLLPLHDASAQTTGVLILIQDMTTPLEYEEQLERRFRLLVESVKDYAIFMLDLEGRVVSWNAGAERIAGYRADEIIGRDFACFYTGQDVQRGQPEQALSTAAAEGRFQDEGWRVRQDGSRFWADGAVTPLRGTDGELRSYAVVTHDITERKRAEEELVRLSNAVKMSTDSIVISDIEGKIIEVNEAALEMYGTDNKSDLIGKSSFDFIAPEDREKAFAGMQEVLEKGYVKGREYHVIIKNGSRIPVEMSVAIMQDADGKQIGFMGISRDITERKRAEEELRKHREHLEELVEERTTELRQLVDLMVGREVRMAELKDVIRQLRAQLQDAGLSPVADDPLFAGQGDTVTR